MYTRFVSLIVLFGFILYLGGCTSKRCLSPDEINQVERKSTVWVTTTDGTEYEIHTPKIVDSRLTGYVEGEGFKEIEASDIESMRIEKLDAGKTIILGMIGLTGVIVLIWGMDGDSDSEPCPT